MVDIGPFRAIRYNLDQIGDLSKVIAPPYDVIDADQQSRLYAQHPHNIVRIDLTKPEAGEPEDQRYSRAAHWFEDWKTRGIFQQETQPAIYVLSQTFTGPDGLERTRTGFFARARLTPFAGGPILPHERTLRGPKVDRLKLFRATRTNLSPIFAAYQDRDHQVAQLLERVRSQAPIASAEMGGTKNRVWRMDTAQNIEPLIAAFAAKKLYIADGHHRYETSLAYRDERREKNGSSKDAGYEHVLMFSAAVEDPGMVIFPTHRLVHALPDFDRAQVKRALLRFFSSSAAPGDAKDAQRALKEAGANGNAFLMCTGGERELLLARGDAPWSQADRLPKHPALKSLDVSVLHAVILEHVLGISAESQATQKNLRYSKDFAEALGAPKDPSVQVAFLMNPTKIEEVIAVAESGEVMPQKSTFFYPKLPSGLVLYPLD